MLSTVEEDKTDAPLLAVLMVATTILTVLTILAVIVLFYSYQGPVKTRWANKDVMPGKAATAQQAGNLNQALWLDKEAGKVQLPIEDAKAKVIQENQ